jgi:hypothetical protein
MSSGDLPLPQQSYDSAVCALASPRSRAQCCPRMWRASQAVMASVCSHFKDVIISTILANAVGERRRPMKTHAQSSFGIHELVVRSCPASKVGFVQGRLPLPPTLTSLPCSAVELVDVDASEARIAYIVDASGARGRRAREQILRPHDRCKLHAGGLSRHYVPMPSCNTHSHPQLP